MLCVLDYEAVDEVLGAVGDAISGKVLVNVTSGSPSRARATQQWASEHGADYLDGGVMGDPPDVGSDHVRFSYSGSRAAFEAHEATLRELGSPTYYGADAGLASVEFMAQVAVGYEFLIGLLHTLQLVQKEGVDPAEFAARVAGSVSAYAPLVTAIGEAVRDETYPPDLGPLSVQAALMGDLVDHRQSLGVDTVRMREVKELMEKRVADGHGDQGFSSLFALLDTRQ
jgi:3-hydroxyisobutyrate dehydrogenase-like beta-hydroxyacid dehydrogenase